MKKLIVLLTLLLSLGMVYAQEPNKRIVRKPATHAVGDKWGGGIVISVNEDGTHGLIAETIDLKGGLWTWYAARELMRLECVHSTEGAKYSGWRLPTKDELQTLYLLKDFIGNFWEGPHWSITEESDDKVWTHAFTSNSNLSPLYKTAIAKARAVRDF